jgi:hypothetical protein
MWQRVKNFLERAHRISFVTCNVVLFFVFWGFFISKLGWFLGLGIGWLLAAPCAIIVTGLIFYGWTLILSLLG